MPRLFFWARACTLTVPPTFQLGQVLVILSVLVNSALVAVTSKTLDPYVADFQASGNFEKAFNPNP